MKRAIVLATASLISLSACGGSGSASTDSTAATQGKVNPKYAEFCVTAADLDSKSNATHGEDPTAMSDPEKMKSAWATIMDSSQKLYDAAPDVVKKDIGKMLEGMKAMDKVYAAYKYNLAEMKAVTKVADDLNAIANDKTIASASQHFKEWMTANCGM